MQERTGNMIRAILWSLAVTVVLVGIGIMSITGA